MNCDPDPRTDRQVLDGNTNIGLAITTSEETLTLAKEQTQDVNSGSRPAQNPSEVFNSRTENLSLEPKRERERKQPGRGRDRKREPSQMCPPRSSVNRGRKRFRAESMESVASSLSSGMIRTAVIGETFQDATIIDVPPPLANSRTNSEPTASDGDADISNNGDDGTRDGAEEGGRDRVARTELKRAAICRRKQRVVQSLPVASRAPVIPTTSQTTRLADQDIQLRESGAQTRHARANPGDDL